MGMLLSREQLRLSLSQLQPKMAKLCDELVVWSKSRSRRNDKHDENRVVELSCDSRRVFVSRDQVHEPRGSLFCAGGESLSGFRSIPIQIATSRNRPGKNVR